MDIRTERLLEAFRDSGLSQSDLCARTGINKGALSSYLSGRYFPKQQALEKLSIALNVSIKYLMGLDTSTSENDSSCLFSDAELLLVNKYRQLNEEGQEELMKHINMMLASGLYIKNCQAGLVQEEA